MAVIVLIVVFVKDAMKILVYAYLMRNIIIFLTIKIGGVMTLLTWCENCDNDMHVNGGRACKYCEEEYCLDCIKDHEINCTFKG
jgi:hypothetical protein